ncbi:MAG: hypothetical protein KUG56_05290 [Kordiimonadaceae bacterium]|nr:hypothetical protein [Kordiimonadaceae bacterium]
MASLQRGPSAGDGHRTKDRALVIIRRALHGTSNDYGVLQINAAIWREICTMKASGQLGTHKC